MGIFNAAAVRRVFTSPELAAVLAVLIFAVNYVIGRGIRGDVPPYLIGFTRWAGGAVILLPFVLRVLREDWLPLVRSWRVVVACGFLMPFVGAGLPYVALTKTVAINASVIQISLPVLIILIAWPALGERIMRTKAVGTALGLVGVIAIIAKGDPGALAALSFNSGDLLLLLCNLGLAGYAILTRSLPRVRPLSVVFALCVLGGLFHLPFVVAEFAAGEVKALDWGGIGALAYVAVFPSIFAILLWNYSMDKLGPSRSGMYMFLVPVFGGGLAYAVLGETIAWYHFVGTALIVAGVTVVGRRDDPSR